VAKITIAQQKRLLKQIIGKAGKLCNATNTTFMPRDLPLSIKDFIEIQKICNRALNKLR